MAEELDLDLDTEETENINRTEERIKNLSSKVKDTSRERDEAKAAAQSAESARVAAEKERDFYASFSESAVKYPAASEYRDAIKEKVLAGYSVEDATVSVLNAEGKFTPAVEAYNAPTTGGSAPTQLPTGGEKSVHEMTQDERRNLLIEAEKRGDISLT